VTAEVEIARELAVRRDHLVAGLRRLTGVTVAGDPASSFVLLRIDNAESIRLDLRRRGFATRRCDTFPGLDSGWIRVAVRETATSDAFLEALNESLEAARA
jgi:histidinol-phosphate aminotransferase